MIEVRPITLNDMVDAMLLSSEAHARSSYANLPFCIDDVAETLARHIAADDALAVCARRGGEFCGFILARLEKSMCGPARVAYDTALLVRPGRGFAALRLIQAYRAWAERSGAARITIGVSSGIDIERAGRLLERAGFARVGALYSSGGSV